MVCVVRESMCFFVRDGFVSCRVVFYSRRDAAGVSVLASTRLDSTRFTVISARDARDRDASSQKRYGTVLSYINVCSYDRSRARVCAAANRRY